MWEVSGEVIPTPFTCTTPSISTDSLTGGLTFIGLVHALKFPAHFDSTHAPHAGAVPPAKHGIKHPLATHVEKTPKHAEQFVLSPIRFATHFVTQLVSVKTTAMQGAPQARSIADASTCVMGTYAFTSEDPHASPTPAGLTFCIGERFVSAPSVVAPLPHVAVQPAGSEAFIAATAGLKLALSQQSAG